MPEKRHIIRNLKIREISSVDFPAQQGAVVVLHKSAGSPESITIRKNAAAVHDTGAKPEFTGQDYEDELLKRAEEIAERRNLTNETALAKYLPTDDTLRQLAAAMYQARAQDDVLRKRARAGR